MRRVSFNLLNISDDVISSQNPDTLLQFKKCLEVIDQYFLYPTFLTPYLATVFLFTLTHWSEEAVDGLHEASRIRAMEKEAREMMNASIAEGGTDLETTFLDQLIEALSFINSLKDIARDVKPFTDIAELRSTCTEETAW